MKNFKTPETISEFIKLCEYLEKPDSEIERLLNLAPGHQPKTWMKKSFRNNGDIVGNWMHKELGRSAEKHQSARRQELYSQRNMLREDAEALSFLRQGAPSWCTYTGHYINYGLGETKILLNEYFVKKTGLIGISPSFERIDPSKGYTLDNMEIISCAVNKLRDEGVDTTPYYKTPRVR